MQIAIENAKVESVEVNKGGFHSTLSFTRRGDTLIFSLPLKLEVGSLVNVEILVESAVNAVNA